MARKGFVFGLPIFLIFVLITTAAVLSALAFTYFFRYRVHITIASDAILSKSSLIPLSFITVNYKIDSTEVENFVVTLAKAQAEMIDRDEAKRKVNEVASLQTPLFCFKMKFDDPNDEYDWFENDDIVICEQRSSYRNFYPVPIVFNGTSELVKILEFTTYSIKGRFGVYHEK